MKKLLVIFYCIMICFLLISCNNTKINTIVPPTNTDINNYNEKTFRELKIKYYDYFIENPFIFQIPHKSGFANKFLDEDLIWFSIIYLSSKKDYNVKDDYCIYDSLKVNECVKKYFNKTLDSNLSYDEIIYNDKNKTYETYGFSNDYSVIVKLLDINNFNEDIKIINLELYNIEDSFFIEKSNQNIVVDFREEILKENSKYLLNPQKLKLNFKEVQENDSFYLQYISLENSTQ